MASRWRDAMEVAAAKLAAWDEGKVAAVTGLGGTSRPFAAQGFPFSSIEARPQWRMSGRSLYVPLNAGITSRANQRSCSSNSCGDKPSAQWIM